MILKRNLIVATGVLLGATLAMPAVSAAEENTRTVNSNLDPGDGSCATNGCTLREAITELNLDLDTTDQDQISIALPLFQATITLATPLPMITDPLAIVGGPVVTPTVDANEKGRAFTVDTANGAPTEVVSLRNLIVRDGNTTTAGGGISSADADLRISNSLIDSNQATLQGGGVDAASGTVAIDRSTISGNTSNNSGGGLSIAQAVTIEITRSTISGNNTVDGKGGGISSGGTLTMKSSTVSGNFTQGSLAFGGGLAILGPATILESTIVDNHTDFAALDKDGAYAEGVDPTVNGTIVANNPPAGDGQDLDGGNPTDDFQMAYSLVENSAGAPINETVAGSNVLGQDPGLGVLASNGGPTFTHLPAPGSPAIDKGGTDELSDQRGLSRPADFGSIANVTMSEGSDIGAVEIQIQPATFSSIDPVASSVDDTPTVFGPALPAIPDFTGAEVHLFTDPACANQTGPVLGTSDDDFETTGITASPVPHDAVTTFHGLVATPYGQSACSSGPFPNSISFTHGNPPVPGPGGGSPPGGTAGTTGLRAAALKKCKKKKRKARKKCRKRALQLPV